MQIFELGMHTQFIGEILNVKADETLLENSQQPMIEQIRPPIFAPNSANYDTIGEEVGKAYSMGKSLMG